MVKSPFSLLGCRHVQSFVLITVPKTHTTTEHPEQVRGDHIECVQRREAMEVLRPSLSATADGGGSGEENGRRRENQHQTAETHAQADKVLTLNYVDLCSSCNCSN